jgi:hypothetical protein
VIGLAGARVVVVDDKQDEAFPVLKAFSKRGITAAFFDGRLRGLPRKKDRLIGVRLAVLDMHLGEGHDDNSVASALVRRVERILHPGNGPYAVLIWTDHPELREAFERYVFQSKEMPKPIFTAMITKAECKRGTAILFEHVAARINKELAKVGPLEFIQAWEGACFEAATSVSNALSKIAGEGLPELNAWRREWKTQTLRVLRALAQAEAGGRLNEENCFESISAVLNPLHGDRMEREAPRLHKIVGHQAKEVIDVAGDCNPDRKAELNSMIHLAFRERKGFAPGTIHVYKNKKHLGWSASFVDFLATFTHGGNHEQVAEATSQLTNGSYPMIVEISAACDFAQKKLLANRFLCGLLTPVTLEKRVNEKAAYLKKIGPVMFESKHVPKGQYNLYFSSRQVLSLSLNQTKRLRSDARLRGQALSDLQSWFSYQATRQGMVLVT